MRRFARETRLEPIIVRPLGEINVRERDAASSAVPGFFRKALRGMGDAFHLPCVDYVASLLYGKEAAMKYRKALFFAFLVLSASAPAWAEVRGQEVEYRSGDTRLKGYLAYDTAFTGKRPGVLVVHEWWGLNEYTRKRVRMLAELGYTALALDMYGEGKQAAHPDDAGKLSAEVRRTCRRPRPGSRPRAIFLPGTRRWTPERSAQSGTASAGDRPGDGPRGRGSLRRRELPREPGDGQPPRRPEKSRQGSSS